MSFSNHRLADARSAHDAARSQAGYSQPRVASPDIPDTGGMAIPDDRIDDFIVHWKKAFSETLTREEARTRAFQLVELFKVIGSRVPEDKNGASPASDVQIL